MEEIENLVTRLQQMPLSQIEALSKFSGVGLTTIIKIRRGLVKSPRYCNAAALMRSLGMFPKK
jgi:transcriptional regulator with XRE-family HTH domain